MQARSFISLTLLFMFALLHAQSLPGPTNLEIKLTDATGAAVSDASVQVESTQTGAILALNKSDPAGIARFSLELGTYQVSAQARGFQKMVTQNVKVDTGVSNQITLSLILGSTGACPCVTVQQADIPLTPAPPLTATIPELPLSGQFPLRPVKFRR